MPVNPNTLDRHCAPSYPARPLSHELTLQHAPQQLADKLTAQTQHERIAAKLEALFQEVDGLINDLPKQYLENAFDTAEALDTARVAWSRGVSA